MFELKKITKYILRADRFKYYQKELIAILEEKIQL